MGTYSKGATVRADGADGQVVVTHSTGEGFSFAPSRIDHFIVSNGFGARLAKALRGLTLGDAIVIRTARQRIIVAMPAEQSAVIRRRFRLQREIW